MHRRLLALTASLGLALGLFVAAPIASVSGAVPCPSYGQSIGTGNVLVVIYEDADYLGDALCIRASATAGTSVPNLANVTYDNGTDNNCRNQGSLWNNSWNDCVSSYKVSIGCHHYVRFYSNPNYDTTLWTVNTSSNRNWMPFGWDDTMSSVRIFYRAQCATLAAQ